MLYINKLCLFLLCKAVWILSRSYCMYQLMGKISNSYYIPSLFLILLQLLQLFILILGYSNKLYLFCLCYQEFERN